MTMPAADVGARRIKIIVTARQEERAVRSEAPKSMELGHLRLTCQS
jgi:hypothetical protein